MLKTVVVQVQARNPLYVLSFLLSFGQFVLSPTKRGKFGLIHTLNI